MEGQLFTWCGKLTEAVNVAMNSEVAQEERMQAYKVCVVIWGLRHLDPCDNSTSVTTRPNLSLLY